MIYLQGFGTEASQDCATLTSPKLSLNLFYSAVVTTVSLIYLWLFFFSFGLSLCGTSNALYKQQYYSYSA